MLTGYPPFLADTPKKIMKQIEEFKLSLVNEDWEGKSAESLSFVEKTLTVQPQSRMTIGESFQHPWIMQKQEKVYGANPQDIGLDLDQDDFDLFLREVFAILIENFDVELLSYLKDLIESKNADIAKEIIVNDVLNIIENTETYDLEIKYLLKSGLRKLDDHIEYSEFLESVIEEKIHQEQPKFDPDFIFSSPSNTNGSGTEDSTDLDSVSPTKLHNQ